jgi:S-adenosylmethionine decarboxylase
MAELEVTGSCFEGPEKLLEIWFAPSSSSLGKDFRGLRNISYNNWAELLAIVNCCILSTISNDEIDSYLLSESSLFVYSTKFIIKTCGTTTLLSCLPKLFELAARPECMLLNENGVLDIDYVFYSRKAFIFPELQPHPHRDWGQEVGYLKQFFRDGSAYSSGRTNGDQWFCYVWESPSQYFPSNSLVTINPDHTFEILMSDLDKECAERFYQKSTDILGRDTFKNHLKSIIPNCQIDDFIFEPCGYSCNGLLDDGYFTIHVTPEPGYSYASFETNISPSELSYQVVLDEVIRMFSPGKVTYTLFWEKGIPTTGPLYPREYILDDSIHYKFGYYELIYCHFIYPGEKIQAPQEKCTLSPFILV